MKCRDRIKRLQVCLVAVAFAGCFSYVNVPANSIGEGSRTSVSLTSQGALDVQPAFGPSVEELRGTMIRTSPDSIQLFVTGFRRRGNEWVLASNPVSLSAAASSQVRERRFSVIRTAGITIGILGALWLGISTDFLGLGGDPDGTDPDPPNQPPTNFR